MISVARGFADAVADACDVLQAALRSWAALATTAVLGPSPAARDRMLLELAGRGLIDGMYAGITHRPRASFPWRVRHWLRTGRLRTPRRIARRRHRRALKRRQKDRSL